MDCRKIIHIDMDAFYASVALRDRPDLHNRPVVVAWEGPRSVICAASYAARRYGLRSAMPVATAKRLCPQAIYLPPDFEHYRAVSAQIHRIFARYTDVVEPLSLDEAYLDVSDYHGSLPYARDIARAIRADIYAETRLTASAGVAPNKFLAKIASDWRKPNGQFVIAPERIKAFLQHLPVGKIPGVGRVTEHKMQTLGWHTVGELAQAQRAELVLHFGRWGHRLYDLARGHDPRPVEIRRHRQQISTETTLAQDRPLADLAALLPALAAELAAQLQDKQRRGSCVTLKLKTADFHTFTRSQTFSAPLDDASALLQAAQNLLVRFEAAPQGYRLIGLGISQLSPLAQQPGLWDGTD